MVNFEILLFIPIPHPIPKQENVKYLILLSFLNGKCCYLFRIIPFFEDCALVGLKMEESQNEDRKQDKETFKGNFLNGKIFISPPNSTNLYEKGYYGTLDDKNDLYLEPVEALLLIERKRLELYDQESQLMTAKRLIEIFIKDSPNSKFWTNYLVYKDLRNRGYIVKKGMSLETAFRVYKRGAKIGEDTSKILVSVITEGTPISLTNLDEIVTSSKSVRKNLVLAVVDRQGEVTYYNCSAFEINPISREN